MNRNYDILSGALLLLVSGVCFQSCRQDDFGELQTDTETLVAEGRYLTARSEDAEELASDTEEPKLFEVGTPFRLFAFSNPYHADDPEYSASTKTDNHPRFNKVAWEDETAGGLRFINIDSKPDIWFGFTALSDEKPGDDGLVSIDFYGFTYGKKADHPENYIPVDGWPTDGNAKLELDELKHTETVTNGVTDGELKDLMRGVLLNQNIQTAGKSKNQTGNSVILTDNAYTQSVMPFRHCFSRLRFQVSQQGDEENKDAKSGTVPVFDNLYVESIEVTGTYSSGDVYLEDGRILLNSATCNRKLSFSDGFDGKVTVNDTDVGNMIIFPSDGNALRDKGDGYDIGLKITVKSTVRNDIENMVRNTGGDVTKITPETVDGVTWYKGTIVKDRIVDYYKTTDSNPEYLHFRQNTSYLLIITFQKDAVRIITVIPQVEEWLPGEGTAADPWEDQAMGQPQMFNNIVWSDRNLGADHYDPLANDYERTVGYFYQSGRNIPYYPFIPDANHGAPDFTKMNGQGLPDANTRWGSGYSRFEFYPIVDSRILNMLSGEWAMNNSNEPQMSIPETIPTDHYFNFLKGTSNATNAGLKAEQDEHWEEGAQNQPIRGGWMIPSSTDFLSIFPSTPFAGNITMKRGGNNATPMDWGSGDEENGITRKTVSETLRVTVPYYTPDMTGPTAKSQEDAWNILKKNEDPGTTHLEEYKYGEVVNKPGVNNPDGDPTNGYASVYVISRENGHRYSLSDYIKDEYISEFTIREWGTVYAIKNIYTDKAYRMRWRALVAEQKTETGEKKKTRNPCIYIEICRYRCTATDKLDEENYDVIYDWDHPAARLYIPICGLGDWTGQYINFGTECQYATSDPISNDGKTSAVQIKITGNNGANAYISVVKNVINRNFGKQIRVIGGG